MTWGEAIRRALCHYADTGQRCEVFSTINGWYVGETLRHRYSPTCNCASCSYVRTYLRCEVTA